MNIQHINGSWDKRQSVFNLYRHGLKVYLAVLMLCHSDPPTTTEPPGFLLTRKTPWNYTVQKLPSRASSWGPEGVLFFSCHHIPSMCYRLSVATCIQMDVSFSSNYPATSKWAEYSRSLMTLLLWATQCHTPPPWRQKACIRMGAAEVIMVLWKT